ncbi:DNA-protecting protein DprA [Naumannella sp. ID2617S]|nr:DNA-protecting protein DprA [Naumannella sp. ID2617S]
MSPVSEVADAERWARMGLCCASDPADPALTALVEAEGAVAVWNSLSGALRDTPWGRRAAQVRLQVVQRHTEQHGARFVVPGDAEWPDQLDDLAGVGVPDHRLAGAAFGVWLLGPGHLAEWCHDSVAIVGSRASTSYGESVAADLAADLAGRGRTVVSGGAYGIDACAHRGAIAASGRTVAVLANGVEVGYPRGNNRLFEQLRSEQLICSELPPGEHPTRIRFLGRNRLIAALSLGTVMVEAGMRSGARNTMNWGQGLGRHLMAVPGPVTSVVSANPHKMIRDKEAELVTNADQVCELVAPMGQSLLPIERGRGRLLDGLDEVQRTVFEAVPGRGGLSAGELSARCGLDLMSVLDALAEVEDLGLVQQNERGGWKLVPGAVG